MVQVKKAINLGHHICAGCRAIMVKEGTINADVALPKM